MPALTCSGHATAKDPAALFSISLAQWSLHRTFFGPGLNADFRAALRSEPDSVLRGTHHPLDFPRLARQEFGIDAIEHVNTFFYGHAEDAAYLAELKRRADGEGVRSLLIMCDALGAIGAPDRLERARVVERHRPPQHSRQRCRLRLAGRASAGRRRGAEPARRAGYAAEPERAR